MQDTELLDDPIWNALNAGHRMLALGGDLARRYPPEIGPLSGLADQSDAAYEELRTIAEPGGTVVLFLQEPAVPRPGWTLVREGALSQMICVEPIPLEGTRLPGQARLRRLTKEDVPAMVALAELTDPGPFRAGTHELGAFFGIFELDELMAMAGQRIRVPGFVEVSAVCTHPNSRGHGYARTLIYSVIEEIRRGGGTPFLHTFADNRAAIRVYRDLGFTFRRTLHLAVLKNDQ